MLLHLNWQVRECISSVMSGRASFDLKTRCCPVLVSICLTLCPKEGSGDVLAPRQLKGGGSEKGFDPWWALVGFWWARWAWWSPFGHVRSARLVAIWGHRPPEICGICRTSDGKGKGRQALFVSFCNAVSSARSSIQNSDYLTFEISVAVSMSFRSTFLLLQVRRCPIGQAVLLGKAAALLAAFGLVPGILACTIILFLFLIQCTSRLSDRKWSCMLAFAFSNHRPYTHEPF